MAQVPARIVEAPVAPAKKITLKEFKMWLDGLLTNNENRNDLPSREQWTKILAMFERIEEPAAAASAMQTHYWYPGYSVPTYYTQGQLLNNHTHTQGTLSGYTIASGTATITPNGTFGFTTNTGLNTLGGTVK